MHLVQLVLLALSAQQDHPGSMEKTEHLELPEHLVKMGSTVALDQQAPLVKMALMELLVPVDLLDLPVLPDKMEKMVLMERLAHPELKGHRTFGISRITWQ